MGQHGRNRTGSEKTRGDRAFETERHDLPEVPGATGGPHPEGYAPGFAAPWDVQGRPLPGTVGTGVQPISGAPDASPATGFEGNNRRVRQEDANFWSEHDRRFPGWVYPNSAG